MAREMCLHEEELFVKPRVKKLSVKLLLVVTVEVDVGVIVAVVVICSGHDIRY